MTVTEGTNQIVGQDPVRIVAAAREVLAGKSHTGRVPRFWDGHAAERIIAVLLREVPQGSERLPLPSDPALGTGKTARHRRL